MQLLVLVLITATPTHATAVAPTSASASPARRADHPPRPPDRPRRRLRIAGYAALGLGAALLGVMVPAVVAHVAQLRRLTAKEAALAPGERLDAFAWQVTRSELRDLRFDRDLAIGSGVAAGVSLALGAVLLALARGRARDRVTVAPWWLSSGAGLSLRVRLP